jgi:hypothetical protein
MNGRPSVVPVRAPLGFVAFALLAAATVAVRADTPLPPPAQHEAVSADGAFVAVTVPRTATTTVYAVGRDGKRERRWEMYGWFRALYVAPGGEVLVAGYDGLNLLPLECPDDQILLRFFRRGEQVATATLADLLPDRAVLRRTASHLLWREGEGFDAEGHFSVVTVDGVRHLFDPATGRPVAPPR